MSECQNVRMWSVRMSECQNVRMSECQLLSMLMSMSKCRMSKCQNVIMLRCQNVRMSGCQKFHFVDVSLVPLSGGFSWSGPVATEAWDISSWASSSLLSSCPRVDSIFSRSSWCCGGRPQRSDRRTQSWREPWFSQLSQLSQLFQLS